MTIYYLLLTTYYILLTGFSLLPDYTAQKKGKCSPVSTYYLIPSLSRDLLLTSSAYCLEPSASLLTTYFLLPTTYFFPSALLKPILIIRIVLHDLKTVWIIFNEPNHKCSYIYCAFKHVIPPVPVFSFKLWSI